MFSTYKKGIWYLFWNSIRGICGWKLAFELWAENKLEGSSPFQSRVQGVRDHKTIFSGDEIVHHFASVESGPKKAVWILFISVLFFSLFTY